MLLLVHRGMHIGRPRFQAKMAAIEPSVWPNGIRWRARVQYDGEDFRGSQIQPNARTVAGLLERALYSRFNQPIRVVLASRTDTGVHARGQTVHFDVPWSCVKSPIAPERLQRSVNALLPDDVRVLDFELAPEVDSLGRPWHAIRWATGKLCKASPIKPCLHLMCLSSQSCIMGLTDSYRLHYGGTLDPLLRRQRLHTGHRVLDVDRMALASRHLIGSIDCAALANKRNGEQLPSLYPEVVTRREIKSIEIIEEGDGLFRVDFHVQAALYKMVRNMMGLLLVVGQGQLEPEMIPALIRSRDRAKLPAPVPPHGLTLESVYYNQGWSGKYDHPLHKDKLCSTTTDEFMQECLLLEDSMPASSS